MTLTRPGAADNPARRASVGFGELLGNVGGEFRECHESIKIAGQINLPAR